MPLPLVYAVLTRSVRHAGQGQLFPLCGTCDVFRGATCSSRCSKCAVYHFISWSTCASPCSKVSHSTTLCRHSVAININQGSIPKRMKMPAADIKPFNLRIYRLNLHQRVVDECSHATNVCFFTKYLSYLSRIIVMPDILRTSTYSFSMADITPGTVQDEVAQFAGN